MDNDLYLENLAESDSMDVAQQNTLTSRLNPRGLYKSAQASKVVEWFAYSYMNYYKLSEVRFFNKEILYFPIIIPDHGYVH